MVCWSDLLRGSAVGELVCEVTAVGEYAGRPLKAGDAAQPVGLLCPLCACCVRAVWFLLSAVTFLERNVTRLLPIWHYKPVFV